MIKYILKTLWRHRTRTILTVSGSAVALFVFCFVASIQEGLDALTRQHQNQQTLIAFQANKFCPVTSHLPQDYETQIAKIQRVRDVVPIQVFTNNCRASLDVIVFYGLPAERLKAIRAFRLVAGSWESFQRYQDAALVGRAVASRRSLATGDKFSLGQLTITVAGIYESPDPAEENHIYTHLEFLQRGPNRNLVGTVTQFEILLEPHADANALCREIDATFRNRQVATDTRPKGAFQAKSLGDLVQLIRLSHYLGYACVGVVLALVATTILMAVQDRVGEHAVLQTIGCSGTRLFFMVLTESVLLSVLGGGLGVGSALLGLAWTNLAVGAEAVTIAFTPSARLACTGMAVAVTAGILAGLAPAWQVSRAEIVPALRQI